MYSEPIIVCGSGRSGTSLVSGMLHYMGVHMGRDEDMVPANEHNPAGHWEDSNFKMNNLMFINDEVEEEEFVENAKKLVRQRATRFEHWGWKVPSTATVLPYYLHVWKERGHTPAKVIWCKRPLGEVIESMQDHYGWSKDYCHKLIERRLEGIKEGLDKYDVDLMEIDLQDTLKEPERVAEELIYFSGVRPSLEQEKRAKELVVQDRPDSDTEVYIATPNLGELRAEIATWHMAWSHDNRYRRKIEKPSAIPYEVNVNQVIESALEEDADYLLLVDSDNPPVKDPLDLVELDKDIIGLPTPTLKDDVVSYNAMNKVGKSFQAIPQDKRYGLREIDAVGSGCMLIARRVLEDLEDNWFTPKWNEKGTSRRSGDFNFCTKAKKRGWKVWTHFDYPCEHLKTAALKRIMDRSQKNELVV